MTGVINILKPPHMTSHDVVAIARGILGTKKIGHTGTLDPMASGVLVLCVGKATKIVEFLQDDKKLYRCGMVLGCSTDTQDAWGNIVSTDNYSDNTNIFIKLTDKEGIVKNIAIDKLDIDSAKMMVKPFIGEIEQIPPMYSAVKVGGKKLYEIARRGNSIERKPRKCSIYNIDILRVEDNIIWMDILCSKGTYIRTLCHDIGEKFGCGAHMGFLLRLKTGVFSIDSALTIEEFKKWASSMKSLEKPANSTVGDEKISQEYYIGNHDVLKDMDYALSNIKKIELPKELYVKIKNGIKVNLAQFTSQTCRQNELYRVYAEQFIGIAKCEQVNQLGEPIKIKMEKRLF